VKAPSFVQLRGCGRSFARVNAPPFHALRGIDLDIDPGEFLALRGRSGSGKSTLLQILGGLDRPTEGSVVVGGKDLTHAAESLLTSWRGRTVGFVFQSFHLLPSLSVLDNVRIAAEMAGVLPRTEHIGRAEAALAKVGVLDQATKLPAELSGGQQQRVAIARALVNEPPLLLADEPTGNLDSANAEAVLDLLTALAGSGRTLVVVTHDPSVAARASRAVILDDGRIVDDLRRTA
jgi:putative ABC transport system ATP-binding protein